MEKILCLNIDLCCGCGACTVACLDQNDIDVEQKQPAWRRIHKVEEGCYPDVRIAYLSAGCMHCQDSPCLMGCPTGAINKSETTGAILVDQSLCIGCHSCAVACPVGVPRYDADDKMVKCRLCAERVEAGLEPACVRVCPIGALEFRAANDIGQEKEVAAAKRMVLAVRKGAGV